MPFSQRAVAPSFKSAACTACQLTPKDQSLHIAPNKSLILQSKQVIPPFFGGEGGC